MIVCPKCQYENPDTHKFCQRCGNSLIYKECQECGAKVEYRVERCPECDALTAQLWWAIISQPVSSPETIEAGAETEALVNSSDQTIVVTEEEVTTVKAAEVEKETSEVEGSELSPSEAVSENPGVTVTDEMSGVTQIQGEEEPEDTQIEGEESQEIYLDAQQRYRLLEVVNRYSTQQDQEGREISEGIVMDSQPLQKSVLEVLIEQNAAVIGQSENVESQDFWEKLKIPAIARPYLMLQQSLYTPALPIIYDTWEENETAVVLLQNRQTWPSLTEFWATEQLPILQILSCLMEMTKLWQILETVGCRQSLLEEGNLRVDEDQSCSIQQLYPDPVDNELTLQDLGRMWQMLFNQSGHTQYGPLAQLLNDVVMGEVESTEELRSRLAEIAEAQQSTIISSSEEDPPTNSVAVATQIPPTEANMTAPTQPSFPSYKTIGGDDAPTVVLPMQLLSVNDCGYTDVGHQRHHNEDYFGIRSQVSKQETLLGKTIEAKGLYLVCDGMGGHAAGEVASAMAVDTLQRYFETHWKDELPDLETIRNGVLLANQTIYDVNRDNARSGSGRMGTTLVMALVHDTNVAIAHVGDSRIYRYTRKGGLEQLTSDHEVGQREIERGIEPEMAYSRPDAYQLTQALGPRDNNYVNPSINFFEVNEDTLLLLCSDGLSDNDLLELHFQEYISPLISSRSNLNEGMQNLIAFANQYNGHDNITGVAVRIKVRPNMSQLEA
ncbi:MAG: serine/threonine phosphatase [Cyanobacteriota bacterium]